MTRLCTLDQRREAERGAERDAGGHLPRRPVGVQRLDDRLDELQKGEHGPPKLMDFRLTAAYPP